MDTKFSTTKFKEMKKKVICLVRPRGTHFKRKPTHVIWHEKKKERSLRVVMSSEC